MGGRQHELAVPHPGPTTAYSGAVIAATTSATGATATNQWVILVGMVLTFLGTVIAAFFAAKGHSQAKIGAVQATVGAVQATQANDAVNHRHDGEDRLFDMVVDTRKQVKEINVWKERWDGLPEQIGSADKLTTHFAVIEDRISESADAISRRVDRLDESHTLKHEELSATVNGYIADTAPKLALIEPMVQEVRRHVEWEENVKHASGQPQEQ